MLKNKKNKESSEGMRAYMLPPATLFDASVGDQVSTLS